MFCSNCGKSIEVNNKFCIYCGNKNRYYKENIEAEDEIIENIATEQEEVLKDNNIKNEKSVESEKKQEISNDAIDKIKENIEKKVEEQENIGNQEMSYIKKHWYGKLSLEMSYWVNNVLFNIIFTILITVINNKIDFTNNPILPSILMIVIWLLLLVSTPWILIGLWRSAENHIKKYNKSFWAGVVKLLVIVGWIQFSIIFIKSGIPQIIEFTKIAINNDTTPKYTLKILNNGKELEISGGIRFGLTNDVREYFIKYPKIKVLHLNSNGGRISESHKLSKFLKNKNITTYSSTGCYSACTNIFMSGKYRFINKNAYLGFHQPSFAGLSESDLWEEIEKERRFYLNNGVKKDFVDKAFTTPHNDMWKPSHFELLQAGIISKVVDGTNFSSTDLSLWEDRKKLESDLLKEKVFQAIKIYEPKEFKKIIQIINSSIKNGEPRKEMFLKTRKIAQKLFLKYLPYSSNKLIIDFLKLTIEEMNAIHKKSPIVCYEFSMGTAKYFNPKDYFSKALIKKELNLMAKVIKSGATNPQKIPLAKDVEKIQTKLYISLMVDAGKDFFLLDKKKPTKSEKIKLSKVIIIMFEKILELDYSDKIKLARVMFK